MCTGCNVKVYDQKESQRRSERNKLQDSFGRNSSFLLLFKKLAVSSMERQPKHTSCLSLSRNVHQKTILILADNS